MSTPGHEPFRPPHGEDCPICYPAELSLMTIGMVVVIVGVALVIVLVTKILAVYS
jgi:hypothetical protein